MVRPASASVVLPTRDRPDQVKTAVASILASSFTDFELVVVDQSGTDETATLVQSIAARDGRLRLVRDAGVGSSHARNLGIAASGGALIVFTDDDCRVALDWLAHIVAAFEADPDAGVACGAVLPAPHDVSAGFIVGYEPTARERLSGRMSKMRDAGIGANMAMRRAVLEDVGDWDELLGAGSPFEGAGDRDMVYRALSAGYGLLHLPDSRVTHLGFRDWESGREVMRGRFRGIGGAYAKHLRLGDPVAILLIAQELRQAGAHIVESLLVGRRPIGVGRLVALLSGISGSFAYHVDPTTRLYSTSVGPGATMAARRPPIRLEPRPPRTRVAAVVHQPKRRTSA